jgi:hypothetical protein
MHGDAIDWLLSTVESGETTNTGLAQDLLRHHHVRRLEYEIKRLFAAREFEAVVQRHLDYHILRGTVPLITRSDTVVDVCYHLAKSIRNWRHGDPRRTQYHYQCATDKGVSQSAVSIDALVAHTFAPQIAQGRVAASAVNGLRPVNKME